MMDDEDHDVIVLAGIQGDIAEARQFASQVDDPVERDRLMRWADAVEQQARELDDELLALLTEKPATASRGKLVDRHDVRREVHVGGGVPSHLHGKRRGLPEHSLMSLHRNLLLSGKGAGLPAGPRQTQGGTNSSWALV
jgi:hypothetical protein